MKYYAHFGHKDFILCLGYKGNCIKDYFLHYDESVSNDFVWSQGGKKIHFLNRDIDDWTITFVETGANATIGERLKAVEPYLQGEEMFLANYGDGLSDVPLPAMLETFRRSNAVASLLLVQPTASFDIVNAGPEGMVTEICPLSRHRHLDQRRLLRDAQRDLQLHSPRRRTGARAISAADREAGPVGLQVHRLLAVHGYFQGQATPGGTEPGRRAMEGLESRRHAQLRTTAKRYRLAYDPPESGRRSRPARCRVLCLGSHSDDIEIGCGGTILRLAEQYPGLRVSLGGVQRHRSPGGRGATRGRAVRRSARLRGPLLKTFPDGFMPYVGAEVKAVFEELKQTISPDLIFTHNRKDAHQDHRLIAELTWNTFRNHLILEYEIPKYDGDMGQPNVFVPLRDGTVPEEGSLHHGCLSIAAHQALVSRGHLSLPDAAARDGMQCSQRLRRGFLLPQAGAVKRTGKSGCI